MSRKVSFSDVTSSYVYVLLGFFGHLYIIFSTSLYFSIETELQQRTGLSKETLINYFACLSIIFLLFSLALKWTWPIKFEEAIIVICIWILLRNLLPKDCPCCNPPPPTVVLTGDEVAVVVASQSPPSLGDGRTVATINEEEEKPPDDQGCQAEPFNTIYAVLCVIVMIASFIMNARSWLVSVLFTGLAIMLMIFTTLIPTSCNQFTQANVNTNLLKFTVYSVIWFNNRRKRLTEQVLVTQYRKGMHILYSYNDHQQNHLLCGVKHHHHPYNKLKKKKYKPRYQQQHLADQCDDIACFLCQEECDSLVPRPLFDRLERLSCAIIQPSDMSSRSYRGRADIERARHFVCQLRNVKKIHDIHTRFCDFFSWKNRSYDSEIQNIFDLTKTLWILNVCPIFLLFVFLEYILINYCIHSNIQELRCLIQRVKVMTHIRGADC